MEGTIFSFINHLFPYSDYSEGTEDFRHKDLTSHMKNYKDIERAIYELGERSLLRQGVLASIVEHFLHRPMLAYSKPDRKHPLNRDRYVENIGSLADEITIQIEKILTEPDKETRLRLGEIREFCKGKTPAPEQKPPAPEIS